MATALLIRQRLFRADKFAKPVFRAAAGQARFESSLPRNKFLVTPAELSTALKQNAPSRLSTAPKTIAVCATWFLPNDPQKRTGYETYKKGHIRKARFFDLDKIADTSSPYPHMLPSPEVFKEAMCNLGISRDDAVVVYDSAELGIFSAPRVAWTFRVFGHPAVHILNNFKLWVDQGYPVEEGEQREFERTQYPTPQLDNSKVCGFEHVRNVAFDHNKEGREEVQILDARSPGRFAGSEPEPRAGLSSGHMPGALSVPVPDLLDAQTKAFLPPDELRRVFQEKGVDPHKAVISSCGTGVTATIIDTALAEAGYGGGVRQVYDGSWTEWAQRVQPSDNLIVKSD
jgi:thiosulfate/3-mercaptopyruvate sulfurtransferase